MTLVDEKKAIFDSVEFPRQRRTAADDEMERRLAQQIEALGSGVAASVAEMRDRLLDIIDTQHRLLCVTTGLLIAKGVFTKAEFFDCIERTTRDVPEAQQKMLAMAQRALVTDH